MSRPQSSAEAESQQDKSSYVPLQPVGEVVEKESHEVLGGLRPKIAIAPRGTGRAHEEQMHKF